LSLHSSASLPSPVVSLRKEGSFARVRPATFLGGELWETYRRATAGARYDRVRRVNLAPLDKVPAILARLRKHGFEASLDAELRTALQERTAKQWMDLQAVRERIDAIGREFHARTGNRFFPYQHTGAVWLALKYTALLADDMGLGKSLQTIVAIPSGAPVLVVAPASIKGVWVSEVEKWRPHVRTTMLKGRDSFRWPQPGEMVVTNYDILPVVHDEKRCDGFLPAKPCEGCTEEVTYNSNGLPFKTTAHLPSCTGFQPDRERCPGCHLLLKKVHTGTVGVFDEVHKIKNGTAQRTVRARALGEAIRLEEGRTWGLTGTPVENSPQELWSVLVAIGAAHEAYGSWKEFLRLANGRPKTFGRSATSRSYGFEWGDPDDEFVDHLRRVSLRRMKADVLPQLPTKMWRRIPVDIDAKTVKACDSLLKRRGSVEDLESLLEKGKGDEFDQLATLRKALAAAKVPSLIKMLDDYEEANEPVVVFSMHREPVDLLGKREGWATITGDVDPAKRTLVVDRFQKGELKGLACTIQAAGEGLTLTRASHAIFVDLSYKPTANEQAEDRLCRIGQTRGVVITLLEADHPIDKRVNDVLTRKRRIIAASVDASSVLEDVPVDASFEDEIHKVQEEIASGRAVRRMAESDEDRAALEGLHTLEFERGDERVALDLAEQAEVIGLSEAQWRLAARIAARGEHPAPSSQQEEKEEKKDDPHDGGGSDVVDGRVDSEVVAMSDDKGKVGKDEHPLPMLKRDSKKKSDPLDSVMKQIYALTPEQRRDLFEELEEIYCVACGIVVEDGEEDHDCPYDDPDEEEEGDDDEDEED
jgi:hypothetical protein